LRIIREERGKQNEVFEIEKIYKMKSKIISHVMTLKRSRIKRGGLYIDLKRKKSSINSCAKLYKNKPTI
jgi:hypothetical protein